MSEGLDGDEGWSDYEEEDDEGYSGGSATIGGDSSYQSSVLEDNSLKGTVISQENGQMQISRRSRDEEIPMGDGDWTIGMVNFFQFVEAMDKLGGKDNNFCMIESSFVG